MHYYLKTDLRGCHEGDKVKIIGKSGIYIQVLMGEETVNIPINVFPLFLSQEPVTPSPARDHAIRREYHPSIAVRGKTCNRR